MLSKDDLFALLEAVREMVSVLNARVTALETTTDALEEYVSKGFDAVLKALKELQAEE